MDSVDFYDNHTLDKTIYERILGLIRKDICIVRVLNLYQITNQLMIFGGMQTKNL